MKKISIIILLVFSILTLKLGALQSEHLEPTGSIFDIYNFEFEYHTSVRDILFKGLSDSPEIRLLVLPSSTPENVLSIEADTKFERFFLVYRICDHQIWKNKNAKSVKVKTYKTEIDKESADMVKALFSAAIMKTMFPEDLVTETDGTQYVFTINNNGNKSGCIWSPKNGTKMGKLVSIGNQLIELTINSTELISFKQKLRNEIVKLYNDLK